MKTRTFVRLLGGTATVAALGIAAPAFAQDVPQTEPADAAPPSTSSATGETNKPGQEIIVTGSRIPQPNLEATSPVTVVTSQEVKLSGTSRTEDLVNSLPQVFASQGSNISNGASGTATISLRGLGAKRNLVLVNGRRLQAGDTGNPVADINFVPSQLVKRVDVLTGGASSVYGADAVAGVVNFIMDTTFTGLRIDGQASVFNHHNHASDAVLNGDVARGFLPPHGWSTNGGAQDIAGMFGAAFDDGRGHVMAYATYRTQDPVLESTRDFSFCTLAARATRHSGTPPRDFDCGGSSTSATGSFLEYDPVTLTRVDVFQVNGTNFVPGTTPFNFAPYNYFQRPDERYTFGAFGDYEISPAFKPYVELMFMDDQSVAQLAPSGDFGNTNRIACDNALLSAQQLARLCAPGRTFVGSLNGQAGVTQTLTYILRRNVEGGGRQDDIRHTDYRVVAGIRGDLSRGISYDAYYQSGHTLRQETFFNDFSVTRLGRAIDVVAVLNGAIVAPGTPGATIQCRAKFTGIDPNCVPYNVFATGGVDPTALTYLQTPGFQRGNIIETIAHADFTVAGDEYGLRLPWAESGIGLNVGAEYRKESLDFKVDEEFRTGDLAGGGGPVPPVSGQFDVRELFGEIQIPIVEHNFIDEFKIGAGYRFSNYHVGGNSFNTDTYKIEADLAPIRDVRFRASYNRAVRAPNIVELFAPQAIGLSGTVDPCAGPAVGGLTNGTPGGPAAGQPGFTAAQCALTGVTAGQFGNIAPNPANQYQGLFGGNPNLKPETADTWTAGVIVQPRFIPGLALTADYFHIKVKEVIGSLGFDQIISGCLGGTPALCQFVHRAPGTGSLWLGQNGFVVLTNVNTLGTGLKTSGWDFNGTYTRRLGGLGTASVAFVGTLLDSIETLGTECVGLFAGACGTPNPKWRHVLRVGLTMPNGLGVSTRWRHFSGVDAVTAAGPAEERLSSRDYFDLTFTARLAQRLNLRIGANNIFDTDPPLAGGNLPGAVGNGNTFPQVYDSLGRYLFAGFTVDF
jgi:outer membrane receptor protein involved in Fe transport